MSLSAHPSSTAKYDVDPQVVAEAIVRRLLAGRTFAVARELQPA